MTKVYQINDYPAIYPNAQEIRSVVPSDLTEQPWAVWKATQREGNPGKYNKVPCHPTTGRFLKTSEPDTWASFEEAVAAYERGGWSGVGVLMTGNGIVAFDIDQAQAVFEDRPEVKDWVNRMIEASAYIEQSPSGEGYRGFVRAALPAGTKKRSGGLETYDDVRFMTVTGKHLTEVI